MTTVIVFVVIALAFFIVSVVLFDMWLSRRFPLASEEYARFEAEDLIQQANADALHRPRLSHPKPTVYPTN